MQVHIQPTKPSPSISSRQRRKWLAQQLERAGIAPAGLTVHRHMPTASLTWNQEATPGLDPAALETTLRRIPGISVQRVQVIQSAPEVLHRTCIVTAWVGLQLTAPVLPLVAPLHIPATPPRHTDTRFFKRVCDGKNEPHPESYPTYAQFYVQWSLWRYPQAGALVAGDRITLRDGRQVKYLSCEQFYTRGGAQRMFRVTYSDLKTGEIGTIEVTEETKLRRTCAYPYSPTPLS